MSSQKEISPTSVRCDNRKQIGGQIADRYQAIIRWPPFLATAIRNRFTAASMKSVADLNSISNFNIQIINKHQSCIFYVISKVIGFFVLFLSVYFLEAIGGFYMVSAVVSVEKQFEIPSRMSGLMISAGDFGYIPSVVFVSYLGGKGNRARWIGGGCLAIAFANVLISMSNFLFPVKSVQLNSTFIETKLVNDVSRLSDKVSMKTFLDYAKNNSANDKFELEQMVPIDETNETLRQYANEKFSLCSTKNTSNNLCKTFFQFLHHSNRPNVSEISNIRILTALPFAFCNTVLNIFRQRSETIRCSKGTSNMGPFIMIFTGLLILGIGRTMPYSLGLPLIDDNVKRQNLPIYFAGMFFIRVLGPVLGFLIGSITNNYYYTFDVPPGLTPRDPMWIGRWWAGFLGIGIVMFGPSLALYLYPTCAKYARNIALQKDDYNNVDGAKNLDGNTAVELQPLRKKKNETGCKRSRGLALVDRHARKDESGRTVVPSSLKEKVIDFLSTVKTILKTPVYVASIIGRIMDVLAMKGFHVFLPKYLEIQFGIPQHKISLYMGIFGVAGFAFGVIIGSLAMRKFKLQGRKAAAYVAICSFIAALLSFVNATVSCKSAVSLLGDNSRLINQNFTTICNVGCDCNSTPLYPVCNRLGQAFYSPCHAGCQLDPSIADTSMYTSFRNCKCSNSLDGEVSRDFCDQTTCKRKFIWYFVNMAISGIFAGMSVIPAILILLRSVPPVDRSISLGFQGFLVSLLATLPSPVIWGWIIDKSCVLWNTVCNDKAHGACALYDSDKLRLTTHITYGIIRLTSLITDVVVCYFAKDLILTDDEPNEEQNRIRRRSHFASAQELVTDIVVNRDRKFTL